ncbi:hypothetical protein [Massilia suwonensis]|uniref:Uncharacterized protein n=1 Tax=Massilia suwonensis TaxID=648895 RepID=A0ABW0MLI5_9BURK
MATQTSSNATPPSDDATVGLGGATSGQAGATPTHETQQETGGSGGDQLTHSTGEIDKAPGSVPQPTPDAPQTMPQTVPDPDGSAMQSGARGAQDTRGNQAGGTGTGLGTPETGANQSEEDLPPAR